MLNDEDLETNIDEQKVIDIDTQKVPIINDSKSLPIWKNIVLFLAGAIGLFVVSLIAGLIVSTFGLGSDVEKNGAATFITYGLLFVALIGIVNIDFLKFLKDKKWPSIVIGVGIGAIMIGFPIFYNMIVYFFREPAINENEQGLRSFINVYPVSSVLILGLVGPVCEELTYRVGLFNVFKKYKWLAYVVSVLIFAFMHFSFTSEDIVNELINLPVYIFSGLALAYAYDRFGFWSSLAAHVTNNIYSVLMVIITYHLGLLGGSNG